jgi:hypothetical protein
LSMGAVFSIFAGSYFWMHKVVGKQYRELLGVIQFKLLFWGVNGTFMPMHFMGTGGMSRRIMDYVDAFANWNLISTIGSFVSSAGLILFFYILYNTVTAGIIVLVPNYWRIGEPVSFNFCIDDILYYQELNKKLIPVWFAIVIFRGLRRSVKESLYSYIYQVYDFNKSLVDLTFTYIFHFAYLNKFTYEEIAELFDWILSELNIHSIYLDKNPIIEFDSLISENFKNVQHAEITLKEEIMSQEKSSKFISFLDRVTMPFYSMFKKLSVNNSKKNDFPMPWQMNFQSPATYIM